MEKNTDVLNSLSKIAEPIASNVVQGVQNILKTRLVYMIDMTHLKWVIETGVLHKYFKHIPTQPMPFGNLVEFHSMITNNVGKYYDYIIWRGTLIVLTIDNRQLYGERYTVSTITLATTRHPVDMKTLDKFVKHLIKCSKQWRTKSSKVMWYNIVGGPYVERYDRPHRSFDDVFIPKPQRYQLVQHLKKFIDNKQWYMDHKIPYHTGIMLYGHPGTGKSSVIQAMISLFDCDVMYVNPGMIESSIERPEWLERTGNDRIRFVIMEDIDVLPAVQKRDTNSESSKIYVTRNESNTARLLNLMDGFKSPENVIWVFTTNHIDKIDEAFIRPGRIDLCVEIGYVTRDTLDQFMRFHYGKPIPDTFWVRYGIVFGDLQGRVMRGETYDDILEYTREVDIP